METTTNPMHPYAPPALVPSSGSSEVTTTTAPGSDWMGSKLMTVENPLSIDYTQALTKEEDEIHPVVVSGGDGGGGHDDHHAEIAPTKVPEWIGNIIEKVFKVKKRGTTVEMECYCGLVQFISCLYVLPVVPFQMKRVGYDETSSIVATTVTCAIGSIASSFLTDMPLIIAPPTSVSIFLAVSMQQSNFSKDEGCAAVILSGASLVVIGALPPVARFISKLIPDCIQAATSVGIGLITALAGCIEISLVTKGKYTILDMGDISSEVIIAIASLILVTAALHYHIKGAFCVGLIFGTFMWWIFSAEWPKGIAAQPETENTIGSHDEKIVLLVFNLLFLYFLTLNGLARSLSDLAGLTKKSGAIPRGNFLLIVCGLTTILSGYFTGPPILISPESAAGIKAGAKTGLSTLVCGILFGIATFFYPIFAAVPAAGTAPLLIMVGVVLFSNVKRIDWADYKQSVPAYAVLFFIPFTYSILRGVAFGYVLYVFIALFTGDLIKDAIALYDTYTKPQPKAAAITTPGLLHDDDDDDHPMHDSPRKRSQSIKMMDTFMSMMDMDAGDIAKIDHA